MFDPNLRLHRWPSAVQAAATAAACVPGALLVRATAAEAALITGEADLERAAARCCRPARGWWRSRADPDGAILRGELVPPCRACPPAVISTVGAGDALTGVLLARLALADSTRRVAPALPEAVLASARACERWGALE